MPPIIPPPLPPSAQTQFGRQVSYVHVRYEGYWVAIDSTIKLSVNGQLYGKYSFKNPFYVSIPIDRPIMCLHAVLSGIRPADIVINSIPGKDEAVSLVYNRFWGSIKFVKLL